MLASCFKDKEAFPSTLKPPAYIKKKWKFLNKGFQQHSFQAVPTMNKSGPTGRYRLWRKVFSNNLQYKNTCIILKDENIFSVGIYKLYKESGAHIPENFGNTGLFSSEYPTCNTCKSLRALKLVKY